MGTFKERGVRVCQCWQKGVDGENKYPQSDTPSMWEQYKDTTNQFNPFWVGDGYSGLVSKTSNNFRYQYIPRYKKQGKSLPMARPGYFPLKRFAAEFSNGAVRYLVSNANGDLYLSSSSGSAAGTRLAVYSNSDWGEAWAPRIVNIILQGGGGGGGSGQSAGNPAGGGGSGACIGGSLFLQKELTTTPGITPSTTFYRISSGTGGAGGTGGNNGYNGNASYIYKGPGFTVVSAVALAGAAGKGGNSGNKINGAGGGYDYKADDFNSHFSYNGWEGFDGPDQNYDYNLLDCMTYNGSNNLSVRGNPAGNGAANGGVGAGGAGSLFGWGGDGGGNDAYQIGTPEGPTGYGSGGGGGGATWFGSNKGAGGMPGLVKIYL